jgi:hypothetical protein
VLRFLETKTDDIDEIHIPGFITSMKNREKLSKARSGGIILSVRENIVKHVKIIDTDCKYVLWFKVDKIFLEYEADLICGIVYIPPEGSEFSSSAIFIEFEQELISVIKDYKHVCLMGDFNARVGHLKDYVMLDDFLTQMNMGGDTYCTDAADRSQVFEKCNIQLEQQVHDSRVNNYGYMQNNDLHIVNTCSRLGSDKFTGGTTCKNSSTVDFILSSLHLFEYLLGMDIVEFCNLYSDVHNPISFTITQCNILQT